MNIDELDEEDFDEDLEEDLDEDNINQLLHKQIDLQESMLCSLRNTEKYTRFLYIITIIGLVIGGIGLLVFLALNM